MTKKSEKNLKHSGILVKKTQEILFSRCRHDMRWDSSHTAAVDGGFDYLKLCGEAGEFDVVSLQLNPKISKADYFSDWNYGKDKYGRHPVSKVGKRGCPILSFELLNTCHNSI